MAITLIGPADCAHQDADLVFKGKWPDMGPTTPYLHNCERCHTSVMRSYAVVGGGRASAVMVEKNAVGANA